MIFDHRMYRNKVILVQHLKLFSLIVKKFKNQYLTQTRSTEPSLVYQDMNRLYCHLTGKTNYFCMLLYQVLTTSTRAYFICPVKSNSGTDVSLACPFLMACTSWGSPLPGKQ